MEMSDERAMDVMAYNYMKMVAERMPPGTLTDVLNELPADQQQALLDASDREQARMEKRD